MKEDFETKAYAAYIKDEEILEKSSSGGIFSIVTDFFLKNNNAVVCAIYNYESKLTEYRLVTSVIERDSARGSKYMQSIPGDIFLESELWLKSNPDKMLLFIGMGCQASGFLQFMRECNLKDRIFVIDIICHGSPSPKLWKEYAELMEHKERQKIEYLSFKDKRNGWNYPFAYIKIGGNEIPIKEYVKIFYNKCALRPSCYKCPYTTTKRSSDMTIGDFWGIEKVMPDFYNKMGNSLVLVHSMKGQNFFDILKNDMEYKECSLKACLQPNLIRPTEKSLQREKFWLDYKRYGINYIMKKYGKVSMIQKIKTIIRKKWGGNTKK